MGNLNHSCSLNPEDKYYGSGCHTHHSSTRGVGDRLFCNTGSGILYQNTDHHADCLAGGNDD